MVGWIFSIYFIVLNIMGFASMGIDKWKAVHRSWRIPEATLFTIAGFGGALGSSIGMYVFRHKTKHWYFRYGLPAITTVWIIIIAFFAGSGMIEIM